jgi:hypothetical protein
MRKIFIFLLLISAIGYAQTFTFVTEHTALSDTLESEIVFEFLITNTSQDTIILYLKWAPLEFPGEWEFSVCLDENCYASFLDSVTTTEEYLSSPLAPGDVRDFSMHVIPRLVPGTGVLYVRAGNMSDLNDTVSVVLTASTGPVSVRDLQIVNSFRLLQNYPNPFNPSTEIIFEVNERSYLILDLYSVTGEKVIRIAEGDYLPGIYRSSVDASYLPSGTYIARLSSDKYQSAVKIMLEK